MGDKYKVWTCFIFTFVVVLGLQSAGCFSNHWVLTDSCGYIGLFSSPCCLSGCDSTYANYRESDGFSIPVACSVLQVCSFVVNLVVCIIFCCLIVRDEYDNNRSKFVRYCCCCWFSSLCVLYPAAGIASVVGCSMVNKADLPDNSSLGYSYYLCLFSGIYVLAQIFFMGCCGACCCEDEKSTSKPPSGVITTTTSSGQMAPVHANLTLEVAEHNEIYESGGSVFVRKLRIGRIQGYLR